jgi:putative chitobiose transport system permease protein
VAWLYLIAPLLLLTLFFFVPTLGAVVMSLWDTSAHLYQPLFVGLANYGALWHSARFWQSLVNTFLLVLGVVPAMATLPIGLALLVNGQLPGMATFRLLLYLPVVTSIVVVGIAWQWLLDSQGLVNYLLSLLGVAPVGWLVNPDIALWAVALVIVWKGLGYYMMMYLAQLQTLDAELYQAAEVDGATGWRRHWHITLPHLQPTIAMVAMLSTIGSLKVFSEIYVMTRGGPAGATRTLVYDLYERAFESLDLGMACAMGVVLMLILLAISLVQLRVFGEARGSA